MKQTKPVQIIDSKSVYEAPKIELIRFSGVDIITASRPGDSNQGEWDPQEYRTSRDGEVHWNNMTK